MEELELRRPYFTLLELATMFIHVQSRLQNPELDHETRCDTSIKKKTGTENDTKETS